MRATAWRVGLVLLSHNPLDRIVRPDQTPIGQFDRLDAEIGTLTAQGDTQRVRLQAQELSEAVRGESDFHDVPLIPVTRCTMRRNEMESIGTWTACVPSREFGKLVGNISGIRERFDR